MFPLPMQCPLFLYLCLTGMKVCSESTKLMKNIKMLIFLLFSCNKTRQAKL